MDGRCGIRGPVFAKIAVVCCTLHNVCERHKCMFEDRWLPYESAYISNTPTSLQTSIISGSASIVQDAIASHIHKHRPAPL